MASIDLFADREDTKEIAYGLTGEKREAAYKDAQARLEEITPKMEAANKAVVDLRAEEKASKKKPPKISKLLLMI